MRDPALWDRLLAYRFDSDTGSEPFSVKLAAEEGWSPAYTARVIEEYRKFLYLTQVSDGQATPSQIVDRAWHLHLTFTNDYWKVLCAEVLRAELHHDPCAGAEDMPRYQAQFEATKALYREEFGSEPPGEVWSGDAPVRRRRRTKVAGWGLMALGAMLFFGFDVLPGLRTRDIPFAALAGIVLVVTGNILATAPGPRKNGRGADGGGGGASGGCGGCGGGGG